MNTFQFPNPRTTHAKERSIQRFLELVPGTLTWFTFISMITLSFLLPLWVAVFVIIFDIYWIFRTIFISSYSIMAYRALKRGEKIDWWSRCQNIVQPKNYADQLRMRVEDIRSALKRGDISLYNRYVAFREKKELLRYIRSIDELVLNNVSVMDWKRVIHVIMFPTANEGPEIIEPAIQAVAESNFPNEQVIILLATEENEPEKKRTQKVEYLRSKFEGTFRNFLVTTHAVAEGEMKCKASNATYAAKELQKHLDREGIGYNRVIFSNFDCDTVCHQQYFAALTYAFITDPKRLQRAYQPLPMYNNNLWDTNAFVRIIVLSSSFWHMFQSTRREMVTFSSHSESFDTLVKVGFWPVNMISEDSIIYWKGYAYFHGDYEVKVIPLPVSLDAVLAPTYVRTIVNQYKQKRRWAYGIENFPVIMRFLWRDASVPFFKKIKVTFEMLEGHHSWATAPFILALLGWMPLIFGGYEFNQSVIAHNLPFVTRQLMSLAMFGLVISVSLSFLLLPPKPKKYSRWRYVNMVFQWILVPFTAPFLGALPAVDSQTRLLFGKYFGSFWVTEKIRKQ